MARAPGRRSYYVMEGLSTPPVGLRPPRRQPKSVGQLPLARCRLDAIPAQSLTHPACVEGRLGPVSTFNSSPT